MNEYFTVSQPILAYSQTQHHPINEELTSLPFKFRGQIKVSSHLLPIECYCPLETLTTIWKIPAQVQEFLCQMYHQLLHQKYCLSSLWMAHKSQRNQLLRRQLRWLPGECICWCPLHRQLFFLHFLQYFCSLCIYNFQSITRPLGSIHNTS